MADNNKSTENTLKSDPFFSLVNTTSIDTEDSIKQKEARLWQLLGNRSLGVNATKKQMQSMAKNNPVEAFEAVQLAADIARHYEKGSSLSAIVHSLDFGEAENTPNMARRIWNTESNIGGGIREMFNHAVDNAKKTAKINPESITPITAVKTLQQLLDCIHFEIKIYNAIPDNSANQKAISASEIRYNDHINKWDKICSIIASWKSDPRKMLKFLQAYKANPLNPLSQVEVDKLNSMINNYSQQVTGSQGATILNSMNQIQQNIDAVRLNKGGK